MSQDKGEKLNESPIEENSLDVDVEDPDCLINIDPKVLEKMFVSSDAKQSSSSAANLANHVETESPAPVAPAPAPVAPAPAPVAPAPAPAEIKVLEEDDDDDVVYICQMPHSPLGPPPPIVEVEEEIHGGEAGAPVALAPENVEGVGEDGTQPTAAATVAVADIGEVSDGSGATRKRSASSDDQTEAKKLALDDNEAEGDMDKLDDAVGGKQVEAGGELAENGGTDAEAGEAGKEEGTAAPK